MTFVLIVGQSLINVQQKWIDMDDLKEFLLAAKKAITDLEIPIPGNVTGPKKDTGYIILYFSFILFFLACS